MDKFNKEIQLYFEMKGSSKQSQESYFRRIRAFIKFFNDRQKSIEDITTTDIQKYILYLKNQRGLSAGTINNYISGIKFFLTHVLNKEWDTKRLPRMKRIHKMPVIPSQEDVLSILDATDNIKHKAILYLLYGSGLRVSEVAKLKISDVCSKTMRIRVDDAKHGTNRYTILSEKGLETLRIYFKQHFQPNSYSLNDWLFKGQDGNSHINVKSIKNMIIKLRNTLELDSRISAHTMRHAFAVHLLENKTELPYIQQLLGHKNPKTTFSYLHMTSKSMMGVKSPLDVNKGVE